ncbi:hypothetical protein CEXT_808201 [Caerostris extrusa]|uniref:Uncharacterized protein n=1 Tax=Caerostris extrusa TaxID=172846 RepID=A0AAV4S5S3_CAEEX|nr:hypothetical protein CEXT_808201 [Caerostris extrusa]
MTNKKTILAIVYFLSASFHHKTRLLSEGNEYREKIFCPANIRDEIQLTFFFAASFHSPGMARNIPCLPREDKKKYYSKQSDRNPAHEQVSVLSICQGQHQCRNMRLFLYGGFSLLLFVVMGG